jgi:hypothetical protein
VFATAVVAAQFCKNGCFRAILTLSRKAVRRTQHVDDATDTLAQCSAAHVLAVALQIVTVAHSC